MTPRVVFVDVDDTMLRSAGPKQIPMSETVRLVKELHEHGVVLYLWSSGGADYARESARKLGVEMCFVGFLPKPHGLIDDVDLKDWKIRQFHPTEVVSVTADEFLERLARARNLNA